MRFSVLALTASCTWLAAAFPKMDTEQLQTYHQENKRKPEACPFGAGAAQIGDAAESGCPFAKSEDKVKRARTFDAAKQRIRTDGEHEFVPPNISGGDQRGSWPVRFF